MPVPRKPSARTRDAAPTPPIKRSRQPAEDAGRPLQLALVEPPSAGATQQPLLPLRQLWLSIHLPALPLEVLVDAPEPAAVFEDRQGIRKILLANRAARAAGIGPGLAVNAGLALLPTLRLEERNPLREARVLQELADWSGKFTSFVCLEPPSLLLLEIAGSLELFGGIQALRQRIVQGLDSQGFAAGVAIAPTPLAATWLARAGRRVCIRDPRNLAGRLASLPLHCTDWPEAVCAALQGMGVATLGEALRLPREGFARRFGAMRLLAFDRALGRLPDPRVAYRAPEPFIADFDLNAEQSDATLLLNACRELLVRLERFLLRRQLAVQQIGFSFFHLQLPATPLHLGCVQADRAVARWFDLLEIRFEQLELPAPVIAIRLCSGPGQQFAPDASHLPFSRRQQQSKGGSIAQLAERLSARIGDDAVHGVMAVAEHRPQHAWQAWSGFGDVPHCPSGQALAGNGPASGPLAAIRRSNSLVLQRPLWLLEEPRLLAADRGVPRYQGLLRLQSGPERIETGWWDADGIARDYFVAVNARGIHLWVYRSRGRDKGSWYLHGMFG